MGIQRYFFKVGPVGLADGTLLSGIVDFFQEGAAAGKGVLELIGNDVAHRGPGDVGGGCGPGDRPT